MIKINQISQFPKATFEVVVQNGNETSHKVHLSEDYYQKLTGGSISPEDLIHKSFEFLLERESKESILREFDLPVIQTYFSEFESTIQ